MLNEDDLCRAFAEKVRDSADFASRVLSYTKFADRSDHSRLLYDEQVAARPKVLPERWWRHWWCKIPESGQERETDIFLVFEDTLSKFRFALHVENKISAPLSFGQAADYALRARHMMGKSQFLDYADFATMLICKEVYAQKNKEKVSLFDAVIFHEVIAQHILQFT